jgi:2-iminobutanoate/2-iminopropanoate deaminase
MLTPIVSKDAPAPIGPYSQAIQAGGWLFCSGQVALGPTGNEPLPEDLADQAHKVMQNLQAVLAQAGATFSQVVKTSIFLRDMADFAVVNEVYASYLQQPYPARETVAVAGLPRNARVEISCVAYIA